MLHCETTAHLEGRQRVGRKQVLVGGGHINCTSGCSSLVYMDFVVPGEGGGVVETLSTLRATIRFLTLMNSLLDNWTVALGHGNGECGLLVHVNPLMSHQRGRVNEILSAVAARVRLTI